MARPTIQKLAAVPETMRESIKRTKASYRQLGNCGLRVSNPILGGLSLGSSRWFPWVVDEDKALGLLKAAYDRGINTWDTANVYSNGESERIIGKALKKFDIPRQKVTIMTKCYRVVCDPEDFDPGASVTMHHDIADQSKDYVNQWAIFNAVEASLRRLDVDYIDLFQVHRFDPTVAPEETMSALHDLVRARVVRYIGASSMWAHQFAALQHAAERNGWTKFVSMQNHYNLLYREEEREMNRYCRMTGVGLIPWAPLAHGRLARHPQRASSEASSSTRASLSPHGTLYGEDDDGGRGSAGILDRVARVADERGWPMSHVSLAWLARRVAAPIVGFSSVERMDEALGAVGKELTPEEERFVEELYVPRAVLGHA